MSNVKCQHSIIFADKMNSDWSIVTSPVLEAKDPIEKQPIAKRVTRSQTKASTNEEVVDIKRKNLSSSNAKSEKGM